MVVIFIMLNIKLFGLWNLVISYFGDFCLIFRVVSNIWFNVFIVCILSFKCYGEE